MTALRGRWSPSGIASRSSTHRLGMDVHVWIHLECDRAERAAELYRLMEVGVIICLKEKEIVPRGGFH